MSEPRILAIGELLADFISTNEVSNLCDAIAFEKLQGGSPANLCANLNWLGEPCALVASVGNDGIGKFLIESIASIGIDPKWIQVVNDVPSSLVLVGKSKASPDFIAYRHADCFLTISDEINLQQFKVVHTTAFALSLDPAQSQILQCFKEAKNNNQAISIDWNFAPQIWGNNNGVTIFESLMSSQTLLKLSLDDCARFTQQKICTAKEAMNWMNQYTFQVCAITCGAEGVWYADAHKNWKHVPAIPVLQIQDTTGAGDAFWAGFLKEWVQENVLDICINNGLEIAAKKLQKVGPLYLGS